MATTYKKILELAPSVTTLTDGYTVPAATQTVCSTILVCNRGNTDATFRISHAVAGAADATKQYLYYDTTVYANDSFAATLGITLGAGDVLRVYASNGNLSFNGYGQENS